jgi:chromosome segregation ATPase
MDLNVTFNVVVGLEEKTREFLAEQAQLSHPSFDFAAAFAALGVYMGKIGDALTKLEADVDEAAAVDKQEREEAKARDEANTAKIADLEAQLAEAKASIGQNEADETTELETIARLEEKLAALKAQKTDGGTGIEVGPAPEGQPGTNG